MISGRLFEINILLNVPNQSIEFDPTTESEVERFQRDYPEYVVNLYKKKFDFENRVKMGEVFKYITDICALRARDDSSIIRTSGADNMGLNPYLLSKTLRKFQSEELGALVNEYKYPLVLLERCPLVHFIDTYSKASARIVAKGGNCNGAFSFRTGLYGQVGGFNPKHANSEDKNLSRRIVNKARKSGQRFQRSGLLESYYDPRRLIASLLAGEASLFRYNNFGLKDHEDSIRAADFDFEHLPFDPALKQSGSETQNFPTELSLTLDNVSKEVASHFEFRARMAFESRFQNTKDMQERVSRSLAIAEKILQQVFSVMRISDQYTIDPEIFEVCDQRGKMRLMPKKGWDNKAVRLQSIDGIVTLMQKRKLLKHQRFESARKETSI